MDVNKERLPENYGNPEKRERSTPIASFTVVARGADSGEVILIPDDLEGANTVRVSRRRLLFYSDESGKWCIPQTWREEGVKVKGNRTGGASRNAYIFYEVVERDRQYPLSRLDQVSELHSEP